jgi:AraC family transcriptional regulator
MKCSKPGEFYGINNDSLHLEGVFLDDSDYLHDRVDWHWHENAYFTFILEGGVIDGNKKSVYECGAGDLLFHNWQDAHYNISSKLFTRGFHVEIKPSWFATNDLPPGIIDGSRKIADPRVKILLANVFKESKLKNSTMQLSIDMLLVEIFSLLSNRENPQTDKKPAWVNKIEEALHENSFDYQLRDLAALAGIHPVHLSRSFARYFKLNLGDYIRHIKIQKALALMTDRNLSLTDIALNTGFADQSHFIRSFKSAHQLSPLQYRKLLIKR